MSAPRQLLLLGIVDCMQSVALFGRQSFAQADQSNAHQFEADTGDVIVCLEDLSTNGTVHNGRIVLHSIVVLSNGDEFEVAAQRFHFTQATNSPSIIPEASLSAKIGDYKILPHNIGSGAFSIVRLAINTKVRAIELDSVPNQMIYTALADSPTSSLQDHS